MRLSPLAPPGEVLSSLPSTNTLASTILLDATMSDMKWQKLESDTFVIFRSAVPGGWLVTAYIQGINTPSLTFYPDPSHKWDGKSDPNRG